MGIVVAGGGGFLGSHLCERLLANGYEVICVDNFLTGRRENVAALSGNSRFRLLECDVTEGLSVPGQVDAVLHFASPASPVAYGRLPVETLLVGGIGTLRLLELARTKKARFVLASTSEVYGDPRVHPQPESYWGHVNPIGPRSMYDESKRYAEALTTAFRKTCQVDTGIVRIFNTFGPRMRPDDGRAIPTFIAQALRGECLTVAGDGLQTRSVCYVDDLIEGVVRMMHSDLAGPVNIGNPHELTVLDTARLVAELCGGNLDIAFVPRPPDDPAVRRPDITLAATKLQWTPKVDVRAGLQATIEWFRADLGLTAVPRIPDQRWRAGPDSARRGAPSAAAGQPGANR